MTKNKSLDDLVFDIFKSIIIEQNKRLLKALAKEKGISYEMLEQKYLKPEYYLPVILSKPTQP